MSALATLKLNTSVITQDRDELDSLTQGSGFLKRIQLYSKGDAVNDKLIGIGEYGIPISKKKIQSLGASIDVVVLARRSKAIDMSNRDAIVCSYDVKSPVFKKIQQIADSKLPNNGCSYGLEFLFLERTTGELYTFMFGGASTRPIAAEVNTFLPCSQEEYDYLKANGKDVSNLTVQGPQAMTMKVEVARNKKGSWHVPTVHPCSTPFTKAPSNDKINEEIEKFKAAKSGGVEKAEDNGEKERVR